MKLLTTLFEPPTLDFLATEHWKEISDVRFQFSNEGKWDFMR